MSSSLLLQRLEEIKKLNDEPSQPKMNTSHRRSAKRTKYTSRPEIEELDKRFRAMKRSNGKIGVRKLYNHEGMVKKKIDQNENIKSPKMSTNKQYVQNDQRIGKKMPIRLAKKANFSYAY